MRPTQTGRSLLPLGQRDLSPVTSRRTTRWKVASRGGTVPPMRISDFQKVIDETYGEKDRRRGLPATFLWFSEEVGELARALNGRTSRENLRLELADTLAWLTTLASMAGIDLEEVAEARYGKGCPRCSALPCRCEERRTAI